MQNYNRIDMVTFHRCGPAQVAGIE